MTKAKIIFLILFSIALFIGLVAIDARRHVNVVLWGCIGFWLVLISWGVFLDRNSTIKEIVLSFILHIINIGVASSGMVIYQAVNLSFSTEANIPTIGSFLCSLFICAVAYCIEFAYLTNRIDRHTDDKLTDRYVELMDKTARALAYKWEKEIRSIEDRIRLTNDLNKYTNYFEDFLLPIIEENEKKEINNLINKQIVAFSIGWALGYTLIYYI
jgi:hypothetical protein